uniref:Myb/SANT-like domain-containing protein n=1 Tax=Populus trichocarpa TaxID=3694 RepID=A0A2K1XCF9_POPTR
MSSTQNVKCKGKHFTWSKPMSHMLLEILAEEALKGSKPSSTFKAESFVKVATEISQKFNVQCEPKHVDNHLKTVKKEWGIITKLKNKSGFGWDDCLKMITVSKDVYDEEVKIGDVALAIQSLSKNQLDVNVLYAEVMKIEGFDEITLGEAFDHLVQNEMLAKAFMAKNANLRKNWVQNFVNQHYYRPAC